MKTVKTFHWKFAPIIGFGYWKDIYDEDKLGIGGVTNNLIFLCLRIQWGWIGTTKEEPRMRTEHYEIGNGISTTIKTKW